MDGEDLLTRELAVCGLVFDVECLTSKMRRWKDLETLYEFS